MIRSTRPDSPAIHAFEDFVRTWVEVGAYAEDDLAKAVNTVCALIDRQTFDIPDGHIVHRLNGNPHDNRPENLRTIPIGEL